MGTRRFGIGMALSVAFVTLTAGCVRRPEPLGAGTADTGQAVTKRDPGLGGSVAPAAHVPTKSPVAPAEVLRRASRAVDGSRKALVALKEHPSPRALAVTCGSLGELEAFLVVSAYLVNDGLLVDTAAAGGKGGAGGGGGAGDGARGSKPVAASDPLADPLQWISSAQSVAPLCGRRGSSMDDFLEDVDSVLGNLAMVDGALGRLAAAR